MECFAFPDGPASPGRSAAIRRTRAALSCGDDVPGSETTLRTTTGKGSILDLRRATPGQSAAGEPRASSLVRYSPRYAFRTSGDASSSLPVPCITTFPVSRT